MFLRKISLICLFMACSTYQPAAQSYTSEKSPEGEMEPMASLCKFDQSDVYDGKVVGLFTPLELTETDDEIAVKGGTFRYAISKKTGQIVSAKVLDTEYLAKGEMLPDPYIGLFPEDDPGATVLGDDRKALYGFEKASRIKPPMYAKELTNSPIRYDARNSVGVEVKIEHSGPGWAKIVSEGRYAHDGKEAGVSWRITYEIDVDSFMRIDVEAIPLKPVLLQYFLSWHRGVASVSIRTNWRHLSGKYTRNSARTMRRKSAPSSARALSTSREQTCM